MNTMSLTNVLFKPSGRISPAAFQKAALILIAIGIVLGILPVISLAFSILGVLGLLLIYPWVCIWVKRLHDANKSGWLFLAVLVVWLIVGWITGLIVTGMFGDPNAAAGAQSFSDVMNSVAAASRATAIPSAIVGAVIAFLFVFVANMVLKSDPGANQYGPPPGPDGESAPPADDMPPPAV